MKYLIFILLYPALLFSQHNYFKRYTTWDGLAQNTIRALHQDPLGRLWVGTAEGFSIYNGNQFTNYSKKQGLGGNVITCFYQYNKSTMWVAAYGEGITIFKKPYLESDTVFKVIKGKKYFADNAINRIFKDSKGRLWFCTDNGITRWSSDKIDSCKVRHFTKKNEPGKIYTYSIDEDKKGNIWIGTQHGLVKYSNGKFAFIKGYKNAVWNVKAYGIDSLWLGTNRGILIYTNGKFIKKFKNSPLAKTEVNALFKDKYSNIWIASDDGLFLYDGTKLNDYSISNGSQNKFILSFLADKEGNFWIGTVDGLNKLLSRNLKYINAKFKYSYLWRIIPLNNGKVYLTTKDGLYTIKKNKLILSPYNKLLPTKSVTNIIFLKDGTKWFGTSLGLFKIKDNTIKSFTKEQGFDSNYILSMIKGGKDSIWIGTKGYWKPHLGRIYLVRNDSVMQPKVLKNLPPDPVTSLFIDKNKNLWIGFFDKGLYELTGNKLRKFSRKDGLDDKDIRDVYQDKDGNIWVMTRFTGIYKYVHGKFKNYNESNGLISNWVLRAVQDTNGVMWFNTAKGVCSFDGKKFKRLNYAGELMSGEMWASAIDSENRLWFGNANYIFTYKPHESNKKHCKIVYIKKFLINSIKPKIQNNIPLNLNYYQNSFTVEFNNVNFENSESVLYQYKLAGLDKNWQPLTKRNFVSYNNLPPGKYRFYVHAKYDDGYWSSINKSIAFIINPPFWQRLWFILLSVLFAAAFVSFITIIIYRYRVIQLLKVERIRTKIATDLHDDIGANLSTISIFTDLASKQISKQPEKASQLMDRIGRIARSLVDSMSDIVWAINPETDSLSDIILKMKNFAFEILQAKGISIYFTISKDIPEIKLSMEERRNLLMIFKESINNAAKYSDAKSVKVILEIIEDRKKTNKRLLKLTIDDNGKGFDKSSYKPGNGLKNIEKRAKEIHADVSIISNVNEGTVINVSFPFSK